jgi:hypothetical protein
MMLLICVGCLNDEEDETLELYPNGAMVCNIEISGSIYKTIYFYRSTAIDDNSFGGIVLKFANEDNEITLTLKMKYKGNGIYEAYNDTKSGLEYYVKTYTPKVDSGWITIEDIKKSDSEISGSFKGLFYSSGTTPSSINIHRKFSAPYPDAKL